MKSHNSFFALLLLFVVSYTLLPIVALADTPPIITLSVPNAVLTLEVARTIAQHEHGLMGRTELAPHHGMLFVFDADSDQYFWMKNTLIPLDMVFIDSNGTVSSVAANVPAMTPGMSDAELPRRHGIGRFVLELPAGEAVHDGFATGLHLRLPAFP